MRILTSLLAAALSASAVPAFAVAPAAAPATLPAAASVEVAPAVASAALKQRADDLIKMINGEASPEQIFSAKVLEKVPAARLSAVAGAVRTKYGRALAVERIDAETENKGMVLIAFEQTQLPVGIGVEAAAPNMIVALQF